MYITSARKNLDEAALEREPHAGSVFAIELDIAGLPETLLKA
jgi:sugar lactone lactonase YvrE